MKNLVVAAIGVAVGAVAIRAGAQGSAGAPAPPPPEHKVTAPGDIKWGDAPPVFQKGAKMAVLYGDPGKEGLFIARLKVPANYKIMPHWHPTDENVTIVSGEFAVGMGDKLDPKTKPVPAGTFISLPAKMHHFAFSKTDAVVEIAAMGPFALTYINPDDDPSKAAAAPKK
ncbi:MAG TPA: cupin domain-containing protein [Haliangiales bacterium]|nr:cupin domain-containing protein [Haliangiales bacterium]